MSRDAREIIGELAPHSMCSQPVLARLYDLARDAAARSDCVIVEIGAWRGASTVALALGLRDGGRGRVHSIDPHREYTGVLGGGFSPADHEAFAANVTRHGVQDRVTHLCADSSSAADGWRQNIDLLWIDGDHSYEGVAADLRAWLGHVAPGGVLVIDDHAPGSEVEAAVRDHLPFARFRALERIGNTLVLRRVSVPRTLVFCGGMQSSGSTLVSMCFLQRADMDGVYDLDNPLIQQDFSRVFTDTVWVKMTIGAFRLREVADLYAAQGWAVRPLFVYREPEEALASLAAKWYGLDGCTGDDPPLHVRLARWRADLRDAETLRWPILRYADLVRDPEREIARICALLDLPPDPAMFSWPKPISTFAYPGRGNASLRELLGEGSGLTEVIVRYRARPEPSAGDGQGGFLRPNIPCLLGGVEGPLVPSRYRGTRREHAEREMVRLRGELGRVRHEMHRRDNYINRILQHRVIGAVIRLWTRLVNPALAKPDWERPEEKKPAAAERQGGER